MSEITVVVWEFKHRNIPIFEIAEYRDKPLVCVSFHRDYVDPVVTAYVTNLPEHIEDTADRRMALGQWTREQARKRQYSEPVESPTHTLLKLINETIARSTLVEIKEPVRLPSKY